MLKTVLKHKVQTYVGKSLEILLAEGRLYKLIDTLQIKQCFPDDMLDLLPQIDEDIKTLNDELEHKEPAAKISISRKFLVYDDDEYEYSIQTQEYLKKISSAITPDLPITDSLIMEDEHLDTIPVTESANTIKSSVEDLVPTPSEFVDLSSFSQQYLCCANCGGPHYDYQCQPINGTYYEPNQSYDYGFDQFQPPKFTVNHQIFNNQNEFLNSQNELLNSQNKLMEQMTTICDLVGQVMQKKEEEKRIAEEQAAKISISRKFPVYDDDDDEYSIQTQEYLKKFSSANTPDLPIEEPVNSLSIGDEHLDTIPATESDEVIKSSVKDPVPIPSECEVISDDDCDLPLNDDSPESHFTTFSNPLFDSNDDFSSDDESLSEEEIQKDEFKYFSNPLYDLDDEIITNKKILPNQKDLDIVIPIPPGIDERCFNAESDLLESLLNRDSPIDSTKIDSIFDEFSLPRPPEIPSSQSFSQIPMEEIDLFLDNSIPPGIDNDDSEGDILPLEELLDNVLSPLPESDDFTVDVEPVAAVTNDFDVLNNDEPFDPGGGENVVFLNVEEDDSFTFTIRTFLPFVTYPEASPLSCSTGSEDTIFDPGIFA
ncbi:hypothetical protein Tco_1298267 [Tanacetum coccineum]